MKKLIVKPKFRVIEINFNTMNVLTNDGIISFDDIEFYYDYYSTYQMLYLRKSGKLVASLCFNKNTTIKVSYKLKEEYTLCNRELECMLAKYKRLRGGE